LHSWLSILTPRGTAGALVAFHTAHKLTLMAHSPRAYAELGRLVAASKSVERAALCERYSAEFMAAMKKLATPARHVNVCNLSPVTCVTAATPIRAAS